MGVLLGLGYVELLLAKGGEIFGQGHLHVLFREKYVYAVEGIVVGRHAVILQVGDGLHAVLVVLCQRYGNLFGAVVAVVEEDYHVSGADAAVHRVVDYGLEELVGNSGFV